MMKIQNMIIVQIVVINPERLAMTINNMRLLINQENLLKKN